MINIHSVVKILTAYQLFTFSVGVLVNIVVISAVAFIDIESREIFGWLETC